MEELKKKLKAHRQGKPPLSNQEKLGNLLFELARTDRLTNQEVVEVLEADGIDVKKATQEAREKLAPAFEAAKMKGEKPCD